MLLPATPRADGVVAWVRFGVVMLRKDPELPLAVGGGEVAFLLTGSDWRSSAAKDTAAALVENGEREGRRAPI